MKCSKVRRSWRERRDFQIAVNFDVCPSLLEEDVSFGVNLFVVQIHLLKVWTASFMERFPE